ncbi:MAG: hypothetical protein K1X54_08245 [Flavobacteriales bacterium]|nr:hypothetical protein [Flavobacteriales bacterium]
MRQYKTLIFCLLILSCGQKNISLEGEWVVTGATFTNGNGIELSLDSLQGYRQRTTTTNENAFDSVMSAYGFNCLQKYAFSFFQYAKEHPNKKKGAFIFRGDTLITGRISTSNIFQDESYCPCKFENDVYRCSLDPNDKELGMFLVSKEGCDSKFHFRIKEISDQEVTLIYDAGIATMTVYAQRSMFDKPKQIEQIGPQTEPSADSFIGGWINSKQEEIIIRQFGENYTVQFISSPGLIRATDQFNAILKDGILIEAGGRGRSVLFSKNQISYDGKTFNRK